MVSTTPSAMAARAELQLSLVADPVSQGDLFGAAGMAAPAGLPPPAAAGSGGPTAADIGPGSLPDEAALQADAAARPRQRPQPAGPPSVQLAAREPEGEPGEDDSNSAESDSDLPRWHHHSLVDPATLTPVLRHYVELKAAQPERVLLYRLGDFFECFFEDAILLSRLLELTLTGKDAGKSMGRVPMAGLPHHAAERYCAELVRRGYSVALCDQLETTPAKGALLRRDITRVLTPGTVLEEGMLAARRNNWLCAVVLEQGRWGLAVADVSTGELRLSEQEGSGGPHQELLQLEAAEVVWPGEETQPAWCPPGLRLVHQPRTPFEAPAARAALLARVRLANLAGLGLAEAPLAQRAAGGLLAYLDSTHALAGDRGAIPLERPRL